MSRIPASARELDLSAKHLHRQGELLRADVPAGPASHLLRVYGVECRMKELFLVRTMRKPQGDTTNIPEGTFGSSGHDIQAGLKALRIPCMLPEAPRLSVTDKKPRYIPRPGQEVPQVKSSDRDVEVGQAHQVWRYGVTHTGSEALGSWLDALVVWLGKQR